MDLRLFQLINQLSGRNWVVDKLMILISNRIRYVYISFLVVFLIKNRFKKRLTVETGGSIFYTLFIHSLFKLFFYKPRPFKKRRVGILIPSKMDSTFPSKHTLLAFAASTTIFMYHRTLGIFMLFMSGLTGFSRIWVGHHYPSDIIGSAILGSLSSIVTHIFSGNRSGEDI
ncbi:phosphatase PAP2 family protein [Bacillus sp. JJ1609]|uniref:phosphatase PAP2 family protein n=1 Tax=Bacillus sp. JJ1609 TaxID=3122977 RepID=UPI002FFE6DFE